MPLERKPAHEVMLMHIEFQFADMLRIVEADYPAVSMVDKALFLYRRELVIELTCLMLRQAIVPEAHISEVVGHLTDVRETCQKSFDEFTGTRWHLAVELQQAISSFAPDPNNAPSV